MSAATSLPSAPSGPPGGFNANPVTREKAYDHIQDLQQRSQDGYSPEQPVAKLLNTASNSLLQAKFLVEERRPDLAFVEYLRAYEIAVGVIPKHGKTYDLDGPQDRQYKQIQNQLNSLNPQYMAIKNIIVNNNKRSGVLPKGYQVSTNHVRSQSQAQQDYASKAPFPQSNAAANGSRRSLAASGPPKMKPSVSPKPESMHARAISHGGSAPNGSSMSRGNDALSSRFASLRMNAGSIDSARPDSQVSNSPVHSSPVSMPSAIDYHGRNSFDALTKSSTLNGRPTGPRGMPNGGPMPPAKLPLDTQLAAAMPKAPSPTYSPARNMQTTGNIALPRHSARSQVPSDNRRSSMASMASMASMSSASARAPNGTRDSGDYFNHPAPDGSIPRPSSRQGPRETRCSAERLFDYLPRFHVLLIDMRSRADFDDGHIYTQNIMCIEPMTLHQGMSAEELQESLVLSPDAEQGLFHERHMYELVVYYDGDTQSERYLSQPSTDREAKLKYLHEALFEFNQDKPLKWPPMLLIGGLDAWVDLVGQQALMQSNTLSNVKPARPVQRRPAVFTAGSSQLRIPKRRVQDFAPLGKDEERAWHERARQESVSAVPQIPLTEEGEDEDDPQALSQYDAAIQDFNQRFPDAGMIDRQSGFMSSQLPQRAPPVPPAKLPEYPSAPPVSQYAQVPRRPAPAAPRMSYTGVGERAVSQSSLTGKSDGLAPYIPAKLRGHNMIIPKTGLINFGVTCYMNSTIQALSATTPLTALFIHDDFKRRVQKNWKGSQGVMPELYSNLIRSLWKGDVQSIKPTTFRSFCGRLNAQWMSDTQQDAKEFFDFLTDCLHEDLNSRFQNTPLKALTPDQEAERERAPKLYTIKMEWNRITHRDSSEILDLFGGQHISRLRCLHCGFTSSTWEYFMSISVEIPISGRATLQDCLTQYCSEERLEDGWNCPRCKQPRDATKRITITRAPQFLVIHFKRFRSFGARAAQKVHTVIDFPLTSLSLSPYMLPPPTPADQALVAQKYDPSYAKLDPAISPPFNYDAYAVIRHHGQTLGSGHYTTAAKDMVKKRWRVYNDTRLMEIEPEGNGRQRLQDADAYIVFYQRVAVEVGEGAKF